MSKNSKHRLRGHFRFEIILILVLDALLVNLSAFLALFLRYEFNYKLMLASGFLETIVVMIIPGALLSIASLAVFQVYSSIWQYAGTSELRNTAFASVVSAALYTVFVTVIRRSLPRSFPFLFALFLFLCVIGSRFLFNVLIAGSRSPVIKDRKRTMLIGAGDAASMAIKEFNSSDRSKNNVICLIDDDRTKHGRRVRGVRVVGGREAIAAAVDKHRIEEIIFCIPSASMQTRKEMLELCNASGARLKALPALAQMANGEFSLDQIRELSIDDLLGRTQIHTDNSAIAGKVFNKTVLITGGGGSIGSELCRQLAELKPARLVIFDIYENNAYDIQQELIMRYPKLEFVVLIGSVQDEDRVNEIFEEYKPFLVCHAAAHKHVPLMEGSPAEAVKNNVFGTYNVARAAGENGTRLFILISTDKAVNPTNVMGATKRLCEMIVQSMNEEYATEYTAVRFGNVMGSNGSVIPLFKKQIAAGGPVTVTDKRITRYFMTLSESVSLILQAGAFAVGGEVFVLDMGKPVRIDDMARQMIRLSGFIPDKDIKIEYIGLRPGEKLFEELLLNTEGLQKTANDLIFVGRQKLYGKDEIQEMLRILKTVLRSDKSLVRETVLSLIEEEPGTEYSVVAENPCDYISS